MARNVSLDILKVFLAILVVLIHMSFIRDKNVLVSQLLVNGICRLAVPLFLIITGYYFVSVNSIEKLTNWIKRLSILYILWMSLYCYRWVGEFGLNQSLFVISFGYLHLWYIVGTLLSGVILYLVRNNIRGIVWSIILLYTIGYVIQIVVYIDLFDKDFYNQYLPRNFMFFCFPFMGLGYLIAKGNLNTYTPPLWIVLLVLIPVLGESYIIFRLFSNGGLVSFDLLLTAFLSCPLIFLYFKNIKLLKSVKIKNISLFSTAIYLIHPFVLHHIGIIQIQSLSSIYQKVIVFVVIFLLSYLLVLINKKLKFLL